MTENKKLPIIISSVVIVLIILTAIFQSPSTSKLSNAMQAIPQNAGIVFETQDIGDLITQISDNKAFVSEIKKTEALSEVANEIDFITGLYNKNDDFRSFADGREFIISVHQSQQYKNSKLYITPITKRKYKRFLETINKEFPQAVTKQISYEEVKIIQFELTQNPEYSFCLAYYNDFMMFGFSDILIQKSIRTLKTTASVAENNKFIQMHQLTGKSTHRILINYEYLPETIYKFIAGNSKNSKFLKHFASISSFEINIANNEILLDGYTLSNEKNNYLGIFKSQEPGKHDLLKSLPQNTSSFVLLNIGKGTKFKENYESFLASFNELKNYRKTLNDWYEKNIGTKKIDFFETIGGELALISYSHDTKIDNRQIIMAGIQNRQKSIDFLKKYTTHNNLKTNEQTINGKSRTIYPFRSNKFFTKAFGYLFENINIKSACLTDDYMVFAESDSLLTEFLTNYNQANNMYDNEFVKTLNRESNIFIYGNLLKSIPVLENFVSSQTHKDIQKDRNFWKKIQGPGIQFLSDSDPIYTTFKIKLGKTNADNLRAEWNINLDDAPVTKPFIVKNHNTGANEILIQTQSNTLYLINNKGKILWKTITDGPIISEVYQIDFYANNKLQLMFNTKNSIYLLDRNGNNVEGYPINFKHKATNGIAVFDYDKKRNYRILFAAENNGVYSLDKNGNLIKGWNFGKTQNKVTHPVQLFQYNQKDYLCFFDKNKLYITNRKGELRVKPNADFPISENTKLYFEEKTETSKARFVLTDPTGAVYFVYLDGSIKRLKIKEFSDKHYFIYENITGSEYPAFIFVDGNTLVAFDRNKKEIFQTQTQNPVNQPPHIYKFSKNDRKIGIVDKQNNQIYLIKNDGTPETGFPLAGSTPFAIRVFEDNDYFSIITSNATGKLINYRLYR